MFGLVSSSRGFAALCVLLCLSGCGPRPPYDRVVLITIDTLRADHLGSFGYPLETSPFLDRLASEGVSFKRAFAHSATTGPSHASMFTGLYPLQHRVQNNGQVLDSSFVTLAEVLAERGFETAAFVSGMSHFGASRIAQGFTFYDEPGWGPGEEIESPKQYRRADATVDRVLEWAGDERTEDRFLLWVHLYDPHKPFQPPRELLEQLEHESPEAEQAHRRFLRRKHGSNVRRKTLRKIHEYDAEVRFVDSELERLFTSLGEQGLGERTLWVVTSDHGQGLGNHRWFGHHRQIYNVQLHVPLIFYSGGETLVPRQLDLEMAEHIDLPATLLDLLGAEMPTQPSPTRARSLAPLLRGEDGARGKRFAFAERRRAFANRATRERGERYALQDPRHKYIWFSEGADEFFDLEADPYEKRNLIAGNSAKQADMKATIERMVETLRSAGEAEMVDEETLRELRALGYVD
jgi:arylsulfatase A-like enzyme